MMSDEIKARKIKTRLKRTLMLCAIGLAAGVALGLMIQGGSSRNETGNAVVVNKGSTPEDASASTGVAGAEIGGAFTLTDQNGNKVTEKSYSGQYRLVYFGFTMCPVICPAGLQKMANTLNELDEDADRIQPIFITVDPERDTPDVLRQYVKQFHPRLVGLTGTPADIESIKKAYRVFATKVEDENLSDYTMDHSTFTYLMGPENQLMSLYRDSDTAESIASDIKSKIGK
jgi:protein SCO1/2